MPGLEYATDEEEFAQAEVAVTDNFEDSDDEEEEASELADRFGGVKKRHVPEPMTEFLWGQARKVGTDFTEDEWKSVNYASLIKSYNTHPDAQMFAAQDADVECPDLKYKEKVAFEKQVCSLKTSFRRLE